MSGRGRILAIKGGDHQASIDLYSEYWSQVYDFSRLYIATIADVEEIVQDIFVKLWGSRYLLREDGDVEGFLFIITRNIVFNKNEKRVNENFFKIFVLVAYGNESYYNSTTVEGDYCASQLKIFIDRLINSLPEQ